MGKGKERHLAEELVVVSEYALDQLECKDLGDVLELVRIADALRYPTDVAPKIVVTQPDASCAAGTCACVVASERVIDSSSSCGSGIFLVDDKHDRTCHFGGSSAYGLDGEVYDGERRAPYTHWRDPWRRQVPLDS